MEHADRIGTKRMRTAARALSVVLHPLFMPFYALLMAFRLDFHLGFFLPVRVLDLPGIGEVQVGDAQLLLIMVFTMTVLFPLTSVLFLRRQGLLSQLDMPRREERIAPFLLTLFYYGLAYWLLRRSGHHEAVASMFTGASLVLAALLAITMRWKISAHTAGMGGLIGALAGLHLLHGAFSVKVLAALVLIAGLLASARLIDSDHTPAQVGSGAVLGFAVVFLCVATGFHP